MSTVIFSVAAEATGALSTLQDTYEVCMNDMHNSYVFIVSRANLQESQNIRVEAYPWVKKSWMHRLFFDFLIAPFIVKRHKAQRVISLQNTLIPLCEVPQTLYLHNSLPFSEHRFSIFVDPLLWSYQNLISAIIFRSIRRADRVVVQTDWMKRACIDRLGVSAARIEVIRPEIAVKAVGRYSPNGAHPTFFYPSGAQRYKNHSLIISAASLLKEDGVCNYSIVFTLSGTENALSAELKAEAERRGLPVQFVGSMSRLEVFEYYVKSILVFPSYIESFGFPLVEATMHATPILVSNCPYAHEVLKGYDKTIFFDPSDPHELASQMKTHIWG